ncbi:PREDICTED: zinc finger protein 85-like [Rhagoletis zephyria]|uniref:zinc finger protein 85-like n=1 Tax=Rhagoletis zephyria TaxID=28612 RepID=UPI0008119682|nr:PREDICTED: zinc finger protein 85-like [Rhagoletis zephyria]
MNNGASYSIHTICRICLELLQNESVYEIFAIPGLAKTLSSCTKLSVEPHDGFPRNICGVCHTRLMDMQHFQKLCVESVQKFQELVSKNLITDHDSVLAVLETAAVDAQNEVVDEDEPIDFDPLLNNKLEMIENEDDVFKMLENVDKEVGDSSKDVKRTEPVKSDKTSDHKCLPNDFDEHDSDCSNFVTMDIGETSIRSSESEDKQPLAARLRKSRRSKRALRNEDIIGDGLDADEYDEGIKKKKLAQKRQPRVNGEDASVNTIECHICQKKFRKPERYEEHMRHHNDKLPHQCSVGSCLKGFTTANGLRLHMEHCHAETCESYPCPEEGCGRTFPRTRLLNWHLRKVHKIAKELREPKCYTCSQCDKVFRCPMALKKHMYKHDGKELPFPCNICGKRFVINSALKDHLMRHAGIKNYVCPYCGVGKTTRQEWNTHINTHTQEKKFHCPQCTYASHNKQNLRMHVKIVHEKIKDYACQYCGKTFGKSNACKMHEMTHTGEKRCECKVCGKRFLYAKALTKHLKTHEKRVLRAIEVYRKRQIENGFMSADTPDIPIPELPSTETHTQEAHQKVAEEILKVCAESTASIPRNPRRVERVDISELAGTAVNPIPSVAVPSWCPQINFMMKEGPYICPDCGQGFNGQGNLKRHHRIVHEGVKDFACRFCHKRFAKAQTLKHHEMTHTGEKPHECSNCGKRFIQYVALKRHMKIHMNKPPPIIPPSVYEAREELELQEREKLETKRKKQEARAAIAELAREQLDEMEHQEPEVKEDLQQLTIMEKQEFIKIDPMTEIEANTELNGELGEFPHINTSTMGT